MLGVKAQEFNLYTFYEELNCTKNADGDIVSSNGVYAADIVYYQSLQMRFKLLPAESIDMPCDGYEAEIFRSTDGGITYSSYLTKTDQDVCSQTGDWLGLIAESDWPVEGEMQFYKMTINSVEPSCGTADCNGTHIIGVWGLGKTNSATAGITVNSPSSNEQVAGGNSYEITWNSNTQGQGYVSIFYEGTPLAYHTPDDGSFIWNAPDIDAANVKIRIYDVVNSTLSGTVFDEVTFDIVSSGSSSFPLLKITSPIVVLDPMQTGSIEDVAVEIENQGTGDFSNDIQLLLSSSATPNTWDVIQTKTKLINSGNTQNVTFTNINFNYPAGDYRLKCMFLGNSGNWLAIGGDPVSNVLKTFTIEEAMPACATGLFASNNKNITEGDILALGSVTNPSSLETEYTYSWDGPGTYDANTQDFLVSNNATLDMAGTYYVTASKTGCPDLNDEVNVTVNQGCEDIGDLRTCDNMSLFPKDSTCTPNLRFSPAFTIGANDFISGTGSIYLDNYKNQGSLELYNGNYNMTVTGDEITTSGFTTENVLADLLGFDFSINYMTPHCDGILIDGKFKLPKFKFSKTSVKTEFTGLYFGEIGARINADIEFNNIGTSKFKIETLKLSYKYDPVDIFKGELSVILPLMYVNAYGEFYNGGVNSLGGEFSVDNGIPLGATGFQLVGGGFDVENIVHPTKRLKLGLHSIIAPIGLASITSADIGAEYDFGGTFTAYGELNFWGNEAAYLKLVVAKTKFEIDAQAQFIRFNDHALLTGRLVGGVYWDNDYTRLEGGIFASLQLPPLDSFEDDIQNKLKKTNYENLAEEPLANLSAFLTGDYIAGKFKFPLLLWGFETHLPIYYYVEFNTPVTLNNFRASLSARIISPYAREKLDNLQPPDKGTKETMYQYFELNIASQYLLIENSLISDFGFYLPNGEFVDESNVNNYNNIELNNNFEDNITTYIISSAIQGDYYIDIESNQNLIISSIQEPPFVEITDVNYNQTANTLTIKWNDRYKHGDAHINLYIDTDLQGKNGVLLAENISENDLTDEITINCNDIVTGIYYIYAIISSDNYVMSTSYYNEQIIIEQTGSPNAPTNLNYTFDDDKVEFTWDKITESDINYILYYTNDSSEINYMSNSIGNGDTAKIAFYDLEPGKFYSFMCVASNNQKESLPSNIVKFTWNTNSLNSLPYITNKEENQTAIINENFSYKINAYDNDGDVLSYLLNNAPTGMTINIDGNITWIPNNSQKGFYNFTVSVTDPYGGIDSIKVNLVTVSLEQNTADIYFDKFQYTGYDDIARVIFEKIKHEDDNQIKIYSNSDLTGIILNLNQLNNNVHYAPFNFSETASSGNNLQVSIGDTIWAEYTDNYPDTIIRDLAYFTEFKSNFTTGDILCAGDTIQFVNKSTGSGMHYAWDFGDGNIADKRHPKHAFEPAPGVGAVTFDVTLTITDDEGRSSTKTQTISMYRKPLVDIGDNVDGCGLVNLDAQNLGSTYLWNTGEETQTVTVVADGLYDVEVTNEHGCANTDNVNVIILPVPTPDFQIQQHICIGSEPINVEGNYDNAGIFAGIGISGNVFNPITAGVGIHEISYTYVNEHGCDATITKTIEVKPLPLPEFVNFENEVCIGADPISLSSNMGNATFSGNGVTNGIFSSVAAGVGTHEITCHVINEFGCENSVVENITVNALPVVSYTNLETTYCENSGNSELIGIPSGGIFSGQGISENNFMPSVAGSGTHTVTYTYTDPTTQCVNTVTHQTVVHEIPNVSITTPTEQICSNSDAITVSGTPINGTFTGTGIIDNELGIFNPENGEIGVNLINYTVANLHGCSNYDELIITVVQTPQAYISGNNEICAGEQTTLHGSGASQFLWNTGETSSDIIVSPNITTEYNLTVTEAGLCSDNLSITVTVNDSPEIPVITQDGMFLSTSSEALMYQWAFDNNDIPGAYSQSYLANELGGYTVEIWNDNNCSNISEVYTLGAMNVEDISGLSNLSIYPNPTSGKMSISLNTSTSKNILFKITDISGKVIFEERNSNISGSYTKEFDLSNNANGLYFIIINIDGKTIIKKISLNK